MSKIEGEGYIICNETGEVYYLLCEDEIYIDNNSSRAFKRKYPYQVLRLRANGDEGYKSLDEVNKYYKKYIPISDRTFKFEMDKGRIRIKEFK